MKTHPFVIENPNQYDWDGDDLKDKKEEIMENALNTIVKGLDRFFKPVYRSQRLISNNGNLHYNLKLSKVSKEKIEIVKDFHNDMFRQNVKMGKKIAVHKKVSEDKILKLCIFFDSLLTGSFESFSYNSSEFWRKLFKKIGIPEEEMDIYMSQLVLDRPSNCI